VTAETHSARASTVLLAVWNRSFSRPKFFMSNSVQTYTKSSLLGLLIFSSKLVWY